MEHEQAATPALVEVQCIARGVNIGPHGTLHRQSRQSRVALAAVHELSSNSAQNDGPPPRLHQFPGARRATQHHHHHQRGPSSSPWLVRAARKESYHLVASSAKAVGGECGLELLVALSEVVGSVVALVELSAHARGLSLEPPSAASSSSRPTGLSCSSPSRRSASALWRLGCRTRGRQRRGRLEPPPAASSSSREPGRDSSFAAPGSGPLSLISSCTRPVPWTSPLPPAKIRRASAAPDRFVAYRPFPPLSA